MYSHYFISNIDNLAMRKKGRKGGRREGKKKFTKEPKLIKYF